MSKETSCRVTDAIIRYVRAERGDLGGLLADFFYDEHYLTDTNNWVPLQASNALFQRARHLFGDDQITYKVGCAAARLGAGGVLEKVTRLLGNPRFILDQAPRLHANLTRTSDLQVSKLTENTAEVRISYHPDVPNIDRESCDFARGVLASIPEFVGLNAARVHESQCHIPIQEKGEIDGYYYRVDDEGNVLAFQTGIDQAIQEGQTVGQLNEDGSFQLRDTLYGSPTPTCVYRMEWDSGKSWLRRLWERTLGRPLAQEDAILARDAAIEELMHANRIIEEKSEALARTIEELRHKSDEAALANETLQQRSAELAASNEELRRRSEQLTLLNAIGRQITSTLDLDELLAQAATAIQANFHFYHVSVYLVDPSFNEIELKGAAGGYAERLAGGLRQIIDKGIVSWVVRHGQKRLADAATIELIHGDDFPQTQAELCLPIQLGGETMGVLDIHADQAEAITDDDAEAMHTICNQLGSAIRNAQLFAKVREATRFKTEFLANMSHELRTPLNTIIGFGDLLSSGKSGGPLNEEQRGDLEKILRSARHLLQLLNDILDISKIEAGKMEIWTEAVDFHSIIRDITPIAISLIGPKPIIFRQEISDDLPPVLADQFRIKQIILNLLSNASKFTERGKIVLGANVVGNEAHISVSDTGIGIAKEDAAKVFETFRQVNGTPSRQVQGTGLGLAICRSLVEMHQGRIWVESTGQGQGSTFIFTLPLATGETAEQAVIRERRKRLAPVGVSPKRPAQARRGTILAIDDEPDVIDLLQRSLGAEGYRVIGAPNGDEGLRLAREIRFTAITLDLMMPTKDGWEVLKQLKSEPETADIPVIIVSIMENLERGFSLGAADYMVKPIDLDLLLHKLERLAARRVLVVDDEPQVLELVGRALEEQGYVVDTASDGEEALARIDTFQPAAMVLDLIMPGVDGFEVISRLRGDPSTMDVRIIILTAKDLTNEDRQFLNNRVEKIIHKGALDSQVVLREVKDALDYLITNTHHHGQETPHAWPHVVTDLREKLNPDGNQAGAKHHILLAEDQPETAELIQRVLKEVEGFSFDLQVVNDGQELLNLLYDSGARPDLILMDMFMPHVTGYEATRKIKSDPALRDIPVIAITAAALRHQLDEALDAGCDACLAKPFQPADLIAEINRLLS